MQIRRLSRREFIKLLGASGIALSAGAFGFLQFSTRNEKRSVVGGVAAAQSTGSWILGQNTSTIAIHASYLHTGHILYIAGSGFHDLHYSGPFEAKLLDPATGFETNLPLPKDLFCHGSTHLSNGNLLIAGGTLHYDGGTDPANCNGLWHGLKDAYEYNVTSGQLVPVQSMAAGRWYPTLLTLADGRVAIYEGFDEYGADNELVEIYDDNAKTWSIKYDPNTSTEYCIGEGVPGSCPGAGTVCFGGTAGKGVSPGLGTYPRMHLLPNGLVVTAGIPPAIYSHNPTTGVFTYLINMAARRHYGTSVLLPLQNISSEKGKVLLVGGSPTSSQAAVTRVEILDFDASSNNIPVLRTVQSLQYARKYLLPVVLPDGKVVVFGGTSSGGSNYVYQPEMFDPVTETWTVLPSASVPRTYHGVAILLYDGTVWTASGTPSAGSWELRTEIFRPWYYTETRPTISAAPVVGGYNGTITIPTPNAADITSVSLVRLMSTTHHYDANQRFLWLQILNKTSNTVVVSAPLNGNIAPPGYYMIHVLNSAGVPSTARMIRIPGSGGDTTPPVQVTGLTVTPVGTGQLDLDWNANPDPDIDHYDVHRSTVSGFTPGPSNRIAQPTSNSYSDTGLSSSTTYYYKVAAVDTSNNIGPASSEVAGTTGGTGGEIFYNVAYPGNAVGGIYTGSATRYGEEARFSSSALVGKSLKIWKVYLRRGVGSPSGDVTAVVRRASDDAVVATFNETLDAASLPTAFAPFDFTLTSAYVIQTGDRILVQYSGPARVDMSVSTANPFDGTNTRRARYTGTAYAFGNSDDIVGSMSSE